VTVAKIKEAVRQRDGHSCTLCGMSNDEHVALHGKQLHVHRRVPNSPYTLDGSFTVCQTCHGSLPKSSPGTDDIYRCGKSLMVYLQPSLRRVIEEAADRNRRSLTSEVAIALEKYLSELGMWPPSVPN
jgi:hypothetical protein